MVALAGEIIILAQALNLVAAVALAALPETKIIFREVDLAMEAGAVVWVGLRALPSLRRAVAAVVLAYR
jgi:hypothetical protein